MSDLTGYNCDSDDSFFTTSAHDSSIDSNCSANSFSSIPSLHDTLAGLFSDVPKNFNVIHINAQSIPAHYPDMLASLDHFNIQAILVSESWLKPCLLSTSYSLPGFLLIRNDRTGSGGGGVAIYLRSHIPFTIVSVSAQPPPSNAGEHLFIEISYNHSKLLLGVYYSPSLRINYFTSFEKILEDLTPSYNHTIIMGDFNTCLLRKDSRTSSFESVATACNMHILPLSATHHFPNSSPSLLDVILVSSLQHVAKHGQCAADAFSYHDLIFLSYKIRPPKCKPKILLQRNFGSINVEKLRSDAAEMDWSSVMESDTIDSKVANFNALLTQLYDTHAPIRPIKIKHAPAPWLTDNIKYLMHKKVVAKAKFKRRPTDDNKSKYFLARNRCNMVCRDEQRHHIHDSVSDQDPAKVWKFLRTLGVGKARPNSTPSNLDINSLNQHFCTASSINLSDKVNTLSYLSSLPTPDYSSFSFDLFTECDIKKSILSISSNAVGGDCISRNMVVPILDEILPVICHILNHSIMTCAFPSIWKEAQIIPLPKKSNPDSFSDYRPISILPFLSKVLERQVHHQLSSFLTKTGLLNPLQSGFRPGHSTVTALVKITDDIRLGMEDRQLTVLTLLDFSNAFNTVDFDILLKLLLTLNVSLPVIDWFRNYLHGRRQRIRIDDSFSSWCETSAGVPQGGVLSPLLFALFINSISKHITSSYHLYADDLQIYSQAPLDRLSDAIADTNSDLNQIHEWSRAYGLSVNPAKTQVIVVGSSRLIQKVDWSAVAPITFNGVVIPLRKSVKNLGIQIDSCLTWDAQMQVTSKKIFASMGSLRRLRNFLPTATKIALSQSLLLPILDYADCCYLDLREDQLNKLERLQNMCIRFVFGLRKYDHVSEFRTKLKWLPIRYRRNTHILSLLHNILFKPSTPLYLKERFIFLHSSHECNLRSSVNFQLKMPAHHSGFYGNSFTVHAVRLWNELPDSIRKVHSLPIFKYHVKNFYMEKLSSQESQS